MKTLRFLADVLAVLAAALGLVAWVVVALVVAWVTSLAAYAQGGPQVMALVFSSLAGCIVICLLLWLGLVLVPRAEAGRL